MRSRAHNICTIFTLIGLLMAGLSGCRGNNTRTEADGFGPGCIMVPLEYCLPDDRPSQDGPPYNGRSQDIKAQIKGQSDAPLYEESLNGPGRRVKSEPIAYPSDAPPADSIKHLVKGTGNGYADFDQPSPPKIQVKAVYDQAMSIMRRGDYVSAGELFDRIAVNAPAHKLAPNALYWKGECFYARGLYQEAINQFSQVIQRYPDSAKAPDAQLKVVYSYNALGDGLTAMANLRGLLEYYPKSPAAEKVRSGKTIFKNP